MRGLIIYEFARYKTLVTNIAAMARQSPENLGHLCHEDWHGECFMTCHTASCRGRAEMATWFHACHHSLYYAFYRCFDEQQ